MATARFTTAAALSLAISTACMLVPVSLADGADLSTAGRSLVSDHEELGAFAFVASEPGPGVVEESSASPSDLDAPMPDDVKPTPAPPAPDAEPPSAEPAPEVAPAPVTPIPDDVGGGPAAPPASPPLTEPKANWILIDDVDTICGPQQRSSSCCSSTGCSRCRPKRPFDFGGWIAQGVSVVGNRPADRYNGPVTFNDRDGEWMVNQFWLYAEKELDTGGCGWDVGGRIDFVYGTDARFTQAADGLEADWNQTATLYQAALPQFYLDVGLNDWALRVGHFYTIIGHEVVAAPDNFFYSHAYTMQYGEPFTHTGMLLSYEQGRWSYSAGLHRGNDQFNDTDGHDALNFLGGATWTSPCDNLSLAFAMTAQESGPDLHEVIYSVVGTWNINRRLTYIIQHDLGKNNHPALANPAKWYGINQYLLYKINCCWKAGLRVEWFRDNDGTRVMGLGAGNRNRGLPPNPPHFAGDFFEATMGLNWTPTDRITVRPELRLDWFSKDGGHPVVGDRPYDAGDRTSQFLFGCDVIWTF